MRLKWQEQQQPQVFPLMILCTTRDDRDYEPCASPSRQSPRASPRPADLRQTRAGKDPVAGKTSSYGFQTQAPPDRRKNGVTLSITPLTEL